MIEAKKLQKEKLKLHTDNSPIYKGGDLGKLQHLLPSNQSYGLHNNGPQMSASSTMIDIISLKSDYSHKLIGADSSIGPFTNFDMDSSVLTNMTLLSEGEKSQEDMCDLTES